MAWTRTRRAESRRCTFHGIGTTLAGLMKHHDVDPHHFMGEVHDIPLDRLARERPPDRARCSRLPGRKFVHTNGNADYAWKVLDRLGIAAVIDHLHDIFAADLTPKPELHGYRKLLEQFEIDPARAVMVDDMVRNLAPAKAARDDDGVGGQWLRARQPRL